MKLIVQIPCLNEETTLPLVINSIPKKIPGIDKIEILVIDDGSSDKTVEVAKKLGVKHFVCHNRNQGLGQSFRDGTLEALKLGADIVVNTDGDNQYPQREISNLVQPIIEGKSDIVVADRQTQTIAHFSLFKKLLQRLGSKIVNIAAGTDIPDAASGFRAYSRNSLIKINTITRFSYCMETIIQAGNKRMAITSIPIETNEKTRESRLFKSNTEHVIKSASAIIRAYVMYRPLAFFVTPAIIILVLGLVPFVRFIILFFVDLHRKAGIHHVESLIVGCVFIMVATVLFSIGIIADLTRANRTINEDNLELTKKLYLNQTSSSND